MRPLLLAMLSLALLNCGAALPSAPNPLLGQPIQISLPTDAAGLGALPAPGAPVTVADFFSPSCVPCRKTVPALYAKRAEIMAAGGKLVLVALLGDGESTEDARTALVSWGISDPSFLVDAGDASRREAGVGALPATLVLDARGVLRWSAPVSTSADDVILAVRSAR